MKEQPPEKKPNTGRFKKGVSGNPGGRPKTPEIFKQHSESAQKKVISLLDARDPKIALQAATLVLAYALGKPVEHHELVGKDGEPLIQPPQPPDLSNIPTHILAAHIKARGGAECAPHA